MKKTIDGLFLLVYASSRILKVYVLGCDKYKCFSIFKYIYYIQNFFESIEYVMI